VAIQNPLDIALNLHDIQLLVSLQQHGASETTKLIPSVLTPKDFDSKLNDFLRPSAGQIHLEDVAKKDHIVIDARVVLLEPREQTEVLLRICPLVEGRFTVLGLKWRLNDVVWNYHTFALQGALLHDSLEHRANRTRASNSSLTFHVGGSLPWLSLHVSGLPDSLLQGGIVGGSLTIKNHGRASAASIFLKANLPWLYVGKQPSATSGEVGGPGLFSTAELVGSSGTLFRIGRDGETLAAGAEVTLPVWLRGAGGGKQTLNMLLQYSPEPSSGKDAPRTVRYVRNAWEVCVLPSIHMFATVAPRAGIAGEYVLTVLLTNFCSNGGKSQECDICIRDICCLSDTWSIQPISSLEGANEDGTQLVRQQESVALSFRVVRRVDSKKQTILSNYLPGDDGTESCKPLSPVLDSALGYLCVDDMAASHQQQCDLIRKTHEAAQSSQDGPRGISSVRRDRAAGAGSSGSSDGDGTLACRPASLEGVCGRHPAEISLLVTWGGSNKEGGGSASSLNVNGYHQVVGISVAPAPPCTKACPLAVDIMHVPSVVRHNFTEEQSCPIPVTVRVANQLLDAQAEAVDIGFGIIQDSWEISSESAISWVGAVQCTIRSLKSATSVDIHLCACVSGPGVYDLNQFTVRLLLHGKCFSFPVHAAVSVESAH